MQQVATLSRPRPSTDEPGRPRPRAISRGLAAVGVMFVFSAAACSRDTASSDERTRSPIATDDALAREFDGSYPISVAASGRVREFTITAAPSTIEILEGRPMEVWAYNGQVPGPTLRITLGDTLRVHFFNRLEQATTIHWHGVRLPNAMDGVPGVTQDAVPPGGSFLYEFTPKDAGTFWFHPHIRSSEQVERGLFGVLIVEEPDPTPFSRELVWVLDDWLLNRDGTLVEDFVTRHDLAHDGRWGNVLTMNGVPTPSVPVHPGERLRIRLINVANGRVFDPGFVGLPADTIAMDGMSLPESVRPSSLDFAPGNRVDLDVTIPLDAVGRTLEFRDHFARQQPLLARLVVSGEPAAPPTGTIARGSVPTWSGAAALEPSLELRLNARAGGPYGLEWTINDKIMRHETAESASTAHERHDAVYRLTIGRFAKLRFTNESARLHPMHMHGVFFKVLARDGVAVDEPAWRDTVLLRGRQTIDVGMVPLDEGDWMLHCHILEHAESGMMTLVHVGSERGHR